MTKIGISKNASMLLGHAKEAYEKSVQIKSVQPEQIQKIVKKYEKVDNYKKQRAKDQEECAKKKREEYLVKLRKSEGKKQDLERANKKRLDKVLTRIELREKYAADFRLMKNKEKSANEIKPKIYNINNNSLEINERMIQKQILETVKLNEKKLYNEYIKAIRERTALQLKMEKNREFDNPFLVAERIVNDKEKIKSRSKTLSHIK